MLDAVNKRLGSTSLEELKSSSHGGETSASHRRGASQSIWARVAGSAAGSFDWGPTPQPAAGTCGFLESFGSSKQLCVVGYKPAEGDDRQGHEALCGGNDCGQLRVDARFKCAHAALASGHNPGFHLLLFKRSGRDQDGRIEAVTLATDAKERLRMTHLRFENPLLEAPALQCCEGAVCIQCLQLAAGVANW